MFERLSKEAVLEQLSFSHDDPSIFVRSQWQHKTGISLCYFLIKWCVALFFLITSVVSIIQADTDEESQATTFIYLSRWGYTLCTLQSLLSVLMLTSALITEKKAMEKRDVLVEKLYKLYWAFVEMATVVAFGITILFWSLQFDGEISAMSAIIHGVNSILMFFDLCIVAHPVKLFHCYWTLLFSVGYCLFSLFYYLTGGVNRNGAAAIYPMLDWSKPQKTALICVGIILSAVVLHFFTYGMFRLRVCVARNMMIDDNHSASSAVTQRA